MLKVNIDYKNSPVSGHISATPNRFLNYADLIQTLGNDGAAVEFQAERTLHLTGKVKGQPVKVFMVVSTTALVGFDVFKAQIGKRILNAKLDSIKERQVNFYIILDSKLTEIEPVFTYSGKKLNYEQLTAVSKFSPLFIYDDSSLDTQARRANCSHSKKYQMTVTPFKEYFAKTEAV